MKKLCLVVAVGLYSVAGITPPLRASTPEEDRETEPPSEVGELLGRFEDEPGVRAVQKRAVDHAELDRGIDRSTARRVRLANLVPEVDAEAAWLDQNDSELRYREELDTGDRGRMRRDSARNRYVEDRRLRSIYSIRAEFHLGGLVFDHDEVAVAREHRRRIEAKRRLTSRAAELYFERRRKQVLYLVAPASAWERRMRLRLAIDRLTAQLDGLTGGWFSRQLGDSQGASGDAPSSGRNRPAGEE